MHSYDPSESKEHVEEKHNQNMVMSHSSSDPFVQLPPYYEPSPPLIAPLPFCPITPLILEDSLCESS